MTGDKDTIRIDKWLWQARFFKTRTLAAKMITGGKVRLNGIHATKPAAMVGPGDTLTFAQERRIRVVEIAAIGTRRGPAPEAEALYRDFSPPPETYVPPAPGFEGKGRPTKKDRRTYDLSRRSELD